MYVANLDSCGTPPFGLENISPYIASILSPPAIFHILQ